VKPSARDRRREREQSIMARLTQRSAEPADAAAAPSAPAEGSPEHPLPSPIVAPPRPSTSHPLISGARLTEEKMQAQAARFVELRRQGRILEALDPKRIRPTRFKNRSDGAFSASNPKFVELRDSIERDGQEHPIVVRRISNAAPYEYEIVSGHRRHAACLALDQANQANGGFTVLAIVREVASNERLVLAMYRENAIRDDLSNVEKGRMFQQWLDEGVFGTQAEVAAAISWPREQVGRCMALAQLPAPVLDAFGPHNIPIRWCAELRDAVETRREAVLAAARTMGDPQLLEPAAIKAHLLNAPLPTASADDVPTKPAKVRDQTLRWETVPIGKSRLRFRVLKQSIIVATKKVPPDRVADFHSALKKFAEDWLAEHNDVPPAPGHSK
jgi:ParB family chromosome partitioning protein